jgi:hypothetical protein
MMGMFKRYRQLLAACLISCSVTTGSLAQQTLTDLTAIDGMDITPDNILNYQIQLLDANPADVWIKGIIQYRNSDLKIQYSFRTTLQPGMNSFSRDKVSPQFDFSSSALKELFQIHKVLPFGTYQYCVIITLPNGENTLGGQGDCLYRKSEDQFMISLIDPENNAKIYEYNPQLSWLATYSFSSELTYRLRIAEIKEGQNTANAIVRNNPIYDEKNLMQNSMVYPMYAKSLKAYQPYAWTVDAYYKGILLGGAEPWKFTIVEDSQFVAVPINDNYYEFQKHFGETTLHIPGQMKLKYVSDHKIDSLFFELLNSSKEPTNHIFHTPDLHYGDNLFSLDFTDRLVHRRKYVLRLKNLSGQSFEIPFVYYNPLFIK